MLSVFSSVAALFLGLFTLARGVGKAFDSKGYIEKLAAFELFAGGAIRTIAQTWMVLEVFGGFLLTIASAAHFVPKVDVSRVEIPGSIGLHIVAGFTLIYPLIDAVSLARRLEIENCTRFGAFFPQRLGPTVVVQDLGAMVLAFALLWLQYGFGVD